MEGYHKPVLLREVLEGLRVQKGKWYLDCTLGDGGVSLEILKLGGKVVGIDVDPQALKRAKARLQVTGYSEQDFILIRGNFRDLNNLINSQADPSILLREDNKFSGVIFDLGVSSLQLENPERGFSFGKIGPLDMRMDPSLNIKAWDLVNNLSRKELYETFKTLGEEKYSWDLANAVVSARQVKPISTTSELAELIKRVARGKDQIHPATRVFQALRMAVNDELGALSEGLEQVRGKIEKNGHILVTSFHSLEDRIVKSAFRKWESEGMGVVIAKKPIAPTNDEILQNPRSRSAKLRVFEKKDRTGKTL